MTLPAGSRPPGDTGLPSHPATLLAALVVDALRASGVGHVIVCPGSRSAPLAYRLAAAARDGGPVLQMRHDERVAAFTALGVGVAGQLAAVVTTSGTAAANLGPAVLEAHHANRPLVLITADRPPALRGTWANQTSELQASLFDGALRARVDLADTDAATDPATAAAALLDALAAARGRPDALGTATARPGPVHLNIGYTEPLLPPGASLAPAPAGTPAGSVGGPPPASASPARARSAPVPLALAAGPRTVVLAGDGAGPDARTFAESARLPLLAEPSSGARRGPQAIGPYRLLLELPDFGGRIERVVAFGRPTLSRPVTRLLSRPEVDVVLVSPVPGWPDPGRPVTRCAAVEAQPHPDGAWSAMWRAAGERAVRAVDGVLDADAAAGVLSGPLLAREITAAQRSGEVLLAASSNPIRDLDLAARTTVDTAQIVANRGLAGIDGTLSTATGIALAAAGAGAPLTRVLIGDVAFLHDVGALLAEPGAARPDLQIVVLNDDGGGIFSLLEYGELAVTQPATAADFERLFGTPHGVDLAALCRGYGIPHHLVADLAQLRAVLAAPLSGTSVLEVAASRARLRSLHARIRSAVHAAAVLGSLEPSPAP